MPDLGLSDTVVRPPGRRPLPTAQVARVPLAPPPLRREGAGRSAWTYALFPVLGSAGVLVLAVTNGPVYLLAGGVFVLGSVAMGVALALQTSGRTRAQQLDDRTGYLAHVRDVRHELLVAAREQREAALAAHPEPAALSELVRSGQLWRRRPQDEDFLLLRVGRGPVAARAAPGSTVADPLRRADPVAQAAADRLLAAHADIEDLPVAVPVRPGTTTMLVGRRADTVALARAMLCSLAALHAPDDVRVVTCSPFEREWSWLAWLPHAHHPAELAGDRLQAAGAAALHRLLAGELERRRAGCSGEPVLVLVVDTPAELAPDLAAPGVAVLHLAEHDRGLRPADIVVRLSGSALPPAADVPGIAAGVHLDQMSRAEADALARQLAPLHEARRPLDGAPTGSGQAAPLAASALAELLAVADAGALDAAGLWRPRAEHRLLRVPFGVDGDGRPVELDLKESALSGMGPHGLVVGATGSGKSELLRTVVTGLAVGHPPEDLALVLVDWKGGATFAGLAGLPHVAGALTDLEDDPAAVHRLAAALRGELKRREHVLRDAGLANIREHRQHRLAGGTLEALPHLVVVVDEFTELLAQQPDLLELFVAIGRLGRSLGVHLLLATQRLEEGRLGGLDSHLSYRVALRTFSAADSRAVISTADAFQLPAVPGSAYLQEGTGPARRLRVATVSAPYVRPVPVPGVAVPAARRFGLPPAAYVPLPPMGLDLSDPDRRSTLDVVVEQLAAAAPPVHQVCLPPLPPAVPLGALLDGLAVDERRGVHAVGAPPERLLAPLGVVDLPERQRQEVFAIDLASGHLGVAGAPQTGKSTLLRTLVTSLAVTHTPDELQVYALDLGGGTLAGLAALPHVGGVAGGSEPDRVRRTVAQLTALLAQRERMFAEQRLDGAATWRSRRAAGTLPADGCGDGCSDGYGDVVLVVDGWAALRGDFADLEQPVTELAVRGLGYGLHLVVGSGRWQDLRPVLRDALGTRLELRLGEPADSVVDRRAAVALPAGVPGRLLVPGGRTGQVALPHLPEPGGTEPEEPAATLARIAGLWPGREAPQVQLLPSLVRVSDLPRPGAGGQPGVPVGLREDLQPAYVDLLGSRDPHLLVLGDPGSGRSAALRTLLAGLCASYSPEELLVVVVDYRRALLDAVDDAHLSRYCAAQATAAGTLRALAERLAARLPGPDVPADRLRTRNWWTGPRAVVVVDDHELVAAPAAVPHPGLPVPADDPLAPLTDLLPHGRDIGLHVVLARSASGIAAAGLQPVLRRLRELGTPGLLLSGSREEGVVLHGARLQQQPPGRAQLVRRQATACLVQVAWVPEEEPAA